MNEKFKNSQIFKNGQIWKSPSKSLAVLQWTGEDEFMLLAFEPKAIHGGSCLVPVSDPSGSGKTIYKLKDLSHRLQNWELTELKFEVRE